MCTLSKSAQCVTVATTRVTVTVLLYTLTQKKTFSVVFFHEYLFFLSVHAEKNNEVSFRRQIK